MGYVRDDRGNEVRETRGWGESLRTALAPDEQSRGIGLAPSMLLSLVLVSIAICGGIMGWTLAVPFIIAIALFVIFFHTTIKLERASLDRRRSGRCPACGFSLEEVPIADDRLRVCPECGGAWRLL